MRLTSTGLPIHGKTTSPPRQATTLPCEARPQAKWRAPREHIDWGSKKKTVSFGTTNDVPIDPAMRRGSCVRAAFY